MKVYPWPGVGLSKAMDRVTNALVEHKSRGVQIVKSELDADLVILHVIGYPETVDAIRRLKEMGKKYAIIQYCLRSTQKPEVHDWLPIWQDAEIVWSYYDLYAAIEKDFGHEATEQKRSFNFYRSPLGVDTTVFHPWPSIPKSFTMMTTGYVAESEGVLEVAEAVKRINGRQWHLGPDLGTGAHSRMGINDQLLAQAYASCSYVAGLRRAEGFELPVIEGLMCGARPICFDQPHYRDWFGSFAEYIPEVDDFETVVQALVDIFERPYRVVTPEEQEDVARLFDWRRIATDFWATLERTQSVGGSAVVRINSQKRRLLWVGDAAVTSGFAKCTHKILDSPAMLANWDIHVLGLNYMGDPHPHKYPIYPCMTVHGGDLFGIRRLPTLIEKIVPDVVVIQNDPWNLPAYMKVTGNTPTVAALAVDGLNCAGKGLNGLKLAIFWTQFGYEQARKGGYTGDAAIIPLGVDANFFTPGDRSLARRLLGLGRAGDAWIVGCVNRNQPRKRLDLTIAYFAEWVKTRQIRNAYLYLHVAPTGEYGWDLPQLAEYYGIANRLIFADPEIGHGVSEESLRETYRAFNVIVNTAQGEGWHLPTMEAMACGVVPIYPDWAALGEWPEDVGLKVPCTSIAATTGGVNVIGGIPDRQLFIEAMDRLYRDESLYKTHMLRGLQLVRKSEFDWNEIGSMYNNVIDDCLKIQPMSVGDSLVTA